MKSATDLALTAYETRPQRAESLYELARHFRVNNMPHAALLFAERAMAIEYPKYDLLFVEDTVYRHGIRQEYAIAAYYDPICRDKGREVCDGLALDRDIPADVRNEARQNLFWYCRSLTELAPSFAPARLQFDPPQGWRAMNPSVAAATSGTDIRINIRAVNYTINSQGYYCYPEGDQVIRTRNFLGVLDPYDVLSRVFRYQELAGPSVAEELPIVGYEDMRIFAWRDRLWANATILQHRNDGVAEQTLVDLGDSGGPLWLMRPDNASPREKNWMPIVGSDARFVYKCDPTVLISAEGGKRLTAIPPIAAENFSGGSQAIPFHGGYLALIHEAIQSPRDGKRCYQHRFVWFDGELKLQKCSHRFFFEQTNQIEFAAGLCWHPDGERLILSYGIRDAEAWVATVLAEDVYGMVCRYFGEVNHGREYEPAAVAGDSRVVLRYNRPLLSMAEVNETTRLLKQGDLPTHPDVWKNWDTWLALQASKGLPKDAPIMDAGGTRESAFLPALAKLGYVDLTNINLDEAREVVERGIWWLKADMTKTGCFFRSVDFVACLSVVEHGVDWRKFFDEMARILRPGGQLCLSFDYWHEPIDCRGQMAFGAPVKIFEPAEVREMVAYATECGLELTGDELDLRCRDNVVEWLGLRYTFLCLLFRRK